MTNITVYDKVKWHYPEGKGCPNLDAAKVHFDVAMNWLKKKKLLSSYGEKLLDVGIDSDFAITSDMLTEDGNRVFSACYKKWLSSVVYGKKPNTEEFDRCYNSILGKSK